MQPARVGVAVLVAVALLGIAAIVIGFSLPATSVRGIGTPPQWRALPTPASLPVAGSAAAPDRLPAKAPRQVQDTLPRSLQGTETDGALRWDDEGHLVVNRGLRDCFDYFLAALGEEELPQLLLRLQAYLRSQLPEPAASEAIAMLERYVTLGEALSQLSGAESEWEWTDASAWHNRMSEIRALRGRFLSPQAIDAFFGEDDAYDQYTLDQLAVMQNERLSPQERAALLADLEYQLTPQVQDALQRAQQPSTLAALTRELRAQGGDADAVFSLRSEQVGVAAAERLQQLDDSRRQWQEKLQAWLEERDELLQMDSLDPVTRTQQLDSRREQVFLPEEWIRVQALERVHDQSGNGITTVKRVGLAD